jgi:hypothetical protein
VGAPNAKEYWLMKKWIVWIALGVAIIRAASAAPAYAQDETPSARPGEMGARGRESPTAIGWRHSPTPSA